MLALMLACRGWGSTLMSTEWHAGRHGNWVLATSGSEGVCLRASVTHYPPSTSHVYTETELWVERAAGSELVSHRFKMCKKSDSGVVSDRLFQAMCTNCVFLSQEHRRCKKIYNSCMEQSKRNGILLLYFNLIGCILCFVAHYCMFNFTMYCMVSLST